MDEQKVQLLAQSLSLSSPSADDVAKAYRSLSSRGSITVACGSAELRAQLAALERAGFHGMRLEGATIRAWKGKEGPCHDTGRSARYRGSAAAAMDDDHHLIYGRIRVCEKTGRIYSSPAYRDWMEVTEGDPALLARLEKEPAPFDCDTFEADAMSLASSTPAGPIPSAERVAVTYPGPFKLLVLKDGSIVRRGDPVSLPIGPARELERSDGALVDSAGSAPDPQNYLALYRERGPACLLPDRPGSAAPRKEADLRALGEITPEMKRRLQTLISRGDEYFVLTGSDPAQKDGCCPSNDVGEANRLAAAGILESWGAAANSDCPTNIYAFAGEIRRDGPRPAFAKNEALRGSVKERLERTGFGARVLVRLALLAILLAGLAALAWALLLRSRC